LARPRFETARDAAIQERLIAECARISGVPFPSTRLVEKMGYTAAFITGSGVSENRLEHLPLPVGASRRRSVTRMLTPVGRLRLTCDNPKCDMR
jgi:hypothetical protein